eukprot:TRINITY_DN92058_c0_g1_i1.p1 TRINITY_DN92058_c0_g1~~TRINITY_DN92058_c0_g1_i1.p1  ORF type:complete len:698 (+),score=113.99 TRINITY_DN92058_c0_g1_i1:44-2095(+)
MGNSAPFRELRETSCCTGSKRAGFPPFVPPNASVTASYSFDFADIDTKLWEGATRALSSGMGYPVRENSNGQPRQASSPHPEMVRELNQSASALNLCSSGRLLVRCPRKLVLAGGGESMAESAVVFSICMRGRTIFESFRTEKFVHTAHTTTSGVYFSLCLRTTSRDSGIWLCPRMMLLLGSGDEVCLVEDRLGPVPAPQDFYLDFAIIDQGGKKLQMDLIFRGAQPGPAASARGEMVPTRSAWTLRTCLQDETTFNSYVEPSQICLGTSDLGTLIDGASAYLQNLVISEELVAQSQKDPQVHPWWSEGEFSAGRVLFKGLMASEFGNVNMDQRALLQQSRAPDFWHHFEYGKLSEKRDKTAKSSERQALQGEFWLSKDVVDVEKDKGVYFHCNQSLAQALVTCVIFRFKCENKFMHLIQNNAMALGEAYIPMTGIVLGVEPDPRHCGLLRMFIEFKNEIIEDLIVCDFKNKDIHHTYVHQEVYDDGDTISFRLTLQHPGGKIQTASLKLKLEQLEEDPTQGRQYKHFDGPSLRFPITPSPKCQLATAKVYRVFLYSAVAYDPQDDDLMEMVETSEQMTMLSAYGSPAASVKDYVVSAHESPAISSRDCLPEDWHSAAGQPEDWHSAGDMTPPQLMHSDGEDAGLTIAPADITGRLAKLRKLWGIQFVESAVLVSGVQQNPLE